MKTHRIAAPVTNAALAVTAATGTSLEVHRFDWSCGTWLATGAMMPADEIDTLRPFDAIFLGAVDWAAKVPDPVSLHVFLLPIRKAFAQHANVRPHRLLPGVEGPLRIAGFGILGADDARPSRRGDGDCTHHGALEATTARGIGVTPGKDKTDTFTKAVLTALLGDKR